MYLLGVIKEKNECKKNDISLHFDKILIIAELAEHSPIIIQNSSNPSSWKNLDV